MSCVFNSAGSRIQLIWTAVGLTETWVVFDHLSAGESPRRAAGSRVAPMPRCVARSLID